jgi:predicted RNase H-like nuclease (RuvC/YqgF family)
MAVQNQTNTSNATDSGKTSAMFAPPAAPVSHPAPKPVQPVAQTPYQTQSQTTQSTMSPAAISQSEHVAIENAQLKATVRKYEEEIAALNDRLVKTEGDLEALSQAYTSLDEHATTLQRQLDNHCKKASDTGDGLDDDAIEDLLVCLGQEEEKNAALEAELRALRLLHS